MTTRKQTVVAICITLASLIVISEQGGRRTAMAQDTSQDAQSKDPTIGSPAATSEDSVAAAKDTKLRTDPQQDFAEDDSPTLGVLVGSCPGHGVCVLETIEGSPAESVGIQASDYILAINDQEVSSPKELKQKIASFTSADTINVTIWRRGRNLTKQVALASESESLPGSHRSWLGVMLSDGSENTAGVTVQEVHDNSPADRAGLRSGDCVSKINGEEVESIEQFVEMVQDYEPGAELTLAIRREEQDRDLSVVLGDVGHAPMRWFRQSLRTPLDDDQLSMPLSPEMGMMGEMLDDMRQQIRSLQAQVDELTKPIPPPVSSELEGVEKAPAGQPDDSDVSSREGLSSSFTKLVQYNGRRRLPPNISNDWTESRYGNRGNFNRNNRYRSGYGSTLGNRGYQNYPYRYYNYGGRPFYYGGSYPYGYRGGVRIGNLGVWW